MRKSIAAWGLSLTSLSFLSAAVNADHERGFFIGGSGTFSSNESLVMSPANKEEVSHTGFELVGGYKFNGWLGLDARYGGGASDRSLGTTVSDSNPNPGIINYDIEGYQSVYYRPEITNKEAKLYLLLGYTQLDAAIETFTIGSDGSETRVSGQDFSESGTSYGLGAGWFIDKHININVEYRKLLDEEEDEFDIITIGADYRF